MRKLLLTILLLSVATLARADVYCIGRWEWKSCLDASNNSICTPHWEAPHAVGDIVTGSIDLRSIPQMSLAGGTPQGRGLFFYQSTPTASGLTCYANKDVSITPIRRTAIENFLGISGTTSTTLKDLIYEILALKGDPTGEARWKPLMPEHDGKMQVFGGRNDGVLKTTQLVPFKSPEWQYVLAVIHEDYKRLLKEGSHVRIAKWLDALEEQYDVPYETFIPNGVIKIASLPHATTLTESFNKADSTTLGPDQTWTEIANDLQVFSNRVYPAWGGSNYYLAYARAEADVSSTDHYSKATANFQSGADIGWVVTWHVFTRYSSSADTAYYAEVSEVSLSDTPEVGKNVNGTFTTLNTGSSAAYSANDVLKNKANGSTIECLINDVVKATITDTAITTGTRGGIGVSKDTHNNTNYGYTSVDAWELSDLAAPPASGTIPDQSAMF